MFVLLILLTLADVGLGVLLVAVSGFILQGVNNTGPLPGATLYVLFILLCFLAPLLAWLSWRGGGPLTALALAAAPLVVGGLALMISPPP